MRAQADATKVEAVEGVAKEKAKTRAEIRALEAEKPQLK